jgi:hypothetical protein
MIGAKLWQKDEGGIYRCNHFDNSDEYSFFINQKKAFYFLHQPLL